MAHDFQSLSFFDVSRIGDMDPVSFLRVRMEADGDIVLTIDRGLHPDDRRLHGESPSISIEFCSISGGGGRSTHTRAALAALARAITLDNELRPDARPRDVQQKLPEPAAGSGRQGEA